MRQRDKMLGALLAAAFAVVANAGDASMHCLGESSYCGQPTNCDVVTNHDCEQVFSSAAGTYWLADGGKSVDEWIHLGISEDFAPSGIKVQDALVDGARNKVLELTFYPFGEVRTVTLDEAVDGEQEFAFDAVTFAESVVIKITEVFSTGTSGNGLGEVAITGSNSKYNVESAALIHFSNALSVGPNPATWGSPAFNACMWKGVKCYGGKVIALSLPSKRLAGPLDGALAQLQNLERLVLCKNELTGTIPAVLSKLTKLGAIRLNGNHLIGPLPKGLSQLTNLHTIRMTGNLLTDKLPAEYSALTNLKSLRLGWNSANMIKQGTEEIHYGFTGTLPTEWSTLEKLHSLQVQGNGLSGAVPATWDALTSLAKLDTSYQDPCAANLFVPALPTGLAASVVDYTDTQATCKTGASGSGTSSTPTFGESSGGIGSLGGGSTVGLTDTSDVADFFGFNNLDSSQETAPTAAPVAAPTPEQELAFDTSQPMSWGFRKKE